MSKQKGRKKPSRWKHGIKAGCLALGMATAWGGEARSDMITHVSVAPTTDIRNAFIYYGNNLTTGTTKSLGFLPGGATTTFSQTNLLVDEESGYVVRDGHRPTYMMIGLYGPVDSPGVAVSFPNVDPVTLQKRWSDYFESSPHHWNDYPESQIIGYLQTAEPWNDSFMALNDFLFSFGCSLYDYFGHVCATEYARTATLVGFSAATDLGSAVADVTPAPEPAAWVLIVGAAGVFLFWRRDLLVTQRP
jgi:hypothetical protein